MGRLVDFNSYRVKSTFIDLVSAHEDVDPQYCHPQISETVRAAGEFVQPDCEKFEAGANTQPVQVEDDNAVPMTPSPFMHPSAPPAEGDFMPSYGGYDENLPLAFGELGPEGYGMPNFEYGDTSGTYMQQMQYDPCTGNYVPGYDWYPGYDQSGYGMMDVPADGQDHTEALLAALGDKIAEGKQGDEECLVLPDNTAMEETGEIELPTEAQQECDLAATAAALAAALSASGHNGKSEGGTDQPRSGRRRGGRDRGGGQAAANNSGNAGGNNGNSNNLVAASTGSTGVSSNVVAVEGLQGIDDVPPNFTTVMFRNIPNKYTRDMLVSQLEQDMRGLFDFVYLPIDFKNKCNVGYAFINFRSVEACMSFVNRFNGVEVRKCLPGLISRKVTEVTPARVQGFEENVQRLRNSPVMRELASKPEWMPLIFDGNGEQMSFPSPERPLDPIKPRRRARDDEAYFR